LVCGGKTKEQGSNRGWIDIERKEKRTASKSGTTYSEKERMGCKEVSRKHYSLQGFPDRNVRDIRNE